MEIVKKLKSVQFTYSFDNKRLYIDIPDGISISKAHMVSLARFILRVLQKPQKRKK